MPELDLDRFDRQLLTLVQQDAALTAEQLAEHVSLSASAIQRRLKRLREQGVIQRQVAVLDAAQIGRPTTFITALQVDSERPEPMARLRAWLDAEAAVQQAFYVTGENDFVLVVTAPDTTAYEALMARLLADNPPVRRYTTQVAMGVLKRGLSLPVPE
ncbi:Lrp/AsnC family transcriptional regulator [Pelomonas sp. Root1237]|uniref:Lrp/AsnC family transcriptional regulator n=1 Tax=Pelomonas sp. Root1237 TaxID=1736434 RepID=UPI0006FAAF3A|nr:Lrp/AsnC family transcriptional regulator [Pelomonas sp. Root1237]KQV94713.1 AsnC family transcriptional regulator [Pelomonas sp. Root1237]